MSYKLSERKCLARFFLKGTTRIEDGDNLRRLNLKNVIGQDLNDGIDTFQAKDETLDVHLDAIVNNCPKEQLLTAKIVTWRGILTAIMCHPYSNLKNDIEAFNAVYLNGVVFIEHDHIAKSKRQSDPKFTYYGFRFETICMESVRTKTKEIITNNTVEWTHIFSTSLDDLSLVYGAEIDGVDEFNRELIELKTSKEILTDRDRFTFMRHKIMKTWAQSYLANVQNIIYGFRDENGIVVDVKRYRLHEIPEMAGSYDWDPRKMCKFLKDFLKNVRLIVSMKPGIVFKITLDPSRNKTSSPIITETDLPPFVHL